MEYKQNKKRYAVKVESSESDYALIPYEANVTLIMHGIDQREKFSQNHIEDSVAKEGFAKVYSYGQSDNINFMTIELLGPSLADLYEFCGYKFTLKTTLMLTY